MLFTFYFTYIELLNRVWNWNNKIKNKLYATEFKNNLEKHYIKKLLGILENTFIRYKTGKGNSLHVKKIQK